MYVESEDFRNLWQLAHQWAGYSPDKTDASNLPSQVELNLKRFASAIIRGALQAQTKKIPILFDDSFFDFLFNTRHFFRLRKCSLGKAFNKKYLESILVRRFSFLEWCEKEKYPTPEFWILTQVTENHKVNNRPKNESEDKAVCRAIAKVYWDIDPNIHPKHMSTCGAIRKLGNGDKYLDDATIKDWIADLDPLQKERKTGRPREINYKIDLETGVLLE
jgi:hypothetical protein